MDVLSNRLVIRVPDSRGRRYEYLAETASRTLALHRVSELIPWHTSSVEPTDNRSFFLCRLCPCCCLLLLEMVLELGIGFAIFFVELETDTPCGPFCSACATVTPEPAVGSNTTSPESVERVRIPFNESGGNAAGWSNTSTPPLNDPRVGGSNSQIFSGACQVGDIVPG